MYCETAIIFKDNSGCIFLLKNEKTGSRTKHIETRYFYGRSLFFCEPPKIIPYFVRSEANIADGLTKSQPEKLFSIHSEMIMKGSLIYRREDVEIAIAMRESKDTSMGYGIPEAIKYPDGPDRAYGQTNGELSQMTKEQGLQVIVDDWGNDRGDLRPD